MAKQSSTAVVGALAVVAVAIASGGIIALAFIMPEQMFDSTLGVAAMFGATIAMVVCAVIANLYDLRGIIHEAFG
ncbi:hypothetical protein [Halostella salina]|uniref:hypothetical protein n=1 Tax=Halostella salina TaxID=1547897 RepID=UPI000EF82C1F|nr:hypothetical protein [Halostella salina]